MELFETLILARIADVINIINSSKYLSTPFYLEDYLEPVIAHKLECKVKFIHGFVLYLTEEYIFVNYQLLLNEYNYSFCNAEGDFIFTCDNRPHHPSITTFPHHKHYYPKESHKPLPFSGNLIEVMEEVDNRLRE